jgi:hypothetical protein
MDAGGRKGFELIDAAVESLGNTRSKTTCGVLRPL